MALNYSELTESGINVLNQPTLLIFAKIKFDKLPFMKQVNKNLLRLIFPLKVLALVSSEPLD